MNISFNEDQLALRDSARRFLRQNSTGERVREAMRQPLGYDPAVWRQIGGELGWTGLTIPEKYGGLGLGYLELLPLLEEMGRFVLCSPFFSTICLATNAILAGADEPQRAVWLPNIASGQTRATLALTETAGSWAPEGVAATFTETADGFELQGNKRFVSDGASADLFVVVARAPGTSGSAGIGVFVVPRDSTGLKVEALATMDMSRPQAALTFDAVRVPKAALLGEAGAGWPIVEKTLELAAVGLAAEQVGGAEACLDMAVEYAKVRTQFNRPIGSFQAIKHKCADMLVRVESARSAAYFAAWSAATEAPDLAELAAAAKVYCSEAFFHCAAENIQIHGGIGFTWEHDAHLYFKRAKSSEIFVGHPSYHRELVACAIGL